MKSKEILCALCIYHLLSCRPPPRPSLLRCHLKTGTTEGSRTFKSVDYVHDLPLPMPVNHLCIQNTKLLPKSKSESLLSSVSTVLVCKTQRYFNKLAELGLWSVNIANTVALLYIYMPITRKEIYNLNFVGLWNAHIIRPQKN